VGGQGIGTRVFHRAQVVDAGIMSRLTPSSECCGSCRAGVVGEEHSPTSGFWPWLSFIAKPQINSEALMMVMNMQKVCVSHKYLVLIFMKPTYFLLRMYLFSIKLILLVWRVLTNIYSHVTTTTTVKTQNRSTTSQNSHCPSSLL
jgi:hypothetical protein